MLSQPYFPRLGPAQMLLNTAPPPAARRRADKLLDEDNNSRLVVIPTAGDCVCACVGLAAEGEEAEEGGMCASAHPSILLLPSPGQRRAYSRSSGL